MTCYQITVNAAQYADWDDCLRAAAFKYAADCGIPVWMVSAQWADDQREQITLTIQG